MGYGQSIQLRGKSQVLQAYHNFYRDMEDPGVWAIYTYKNLITKGVGPEDLEAFLDLIATNVSKAIYTLKVYEDLSDPKQVKEKTEASGSINFNLEENDFQAMGSAVYSRNENYSLQKQVAELQQRILELESGGSAETLGAQTLEQAAIGLLNDPQGLAQLISAIKGLFGGTGQPAAPAPRLPQNNLAPAAMNGVNERQGSAEPLSQQDQQRIAAALDILFDKDPRTVDHLEKLASVANRNPDLFKVLLTQLDNL